MKFLTKTFFQIPTQIETKGSGNITLDWVQNSGGELVGYKGIYVHTDIG
jgi:hypothetical protein